MSQDLSSAPRTRGRPRSFDRDGALRSAMELFWRVGFDGASMSDLVAVMGINSPSLYAAFGSKDDLFREAVELYVSSDGRSSWDAMATPGPARTAVEAMLKGTIHAFATADGPRGCLMVLGAKAIAAPNSPAQAYLAERRRELRTRLGRRLEAAAASGEIRADADIPALVALYAGFLEGISVEMADGVSSTPLLMAVDLLMGTWPSA